MSAAAQNPPTPAWDTVRVSLLVDHYKAGLSANESAALIGGVSKNAVVSKRRRLGLLATVDRVFDPAAEGAQSAAARTRAPRARLFRGPPPMPVEPLPEMDWPAPPDSDPRPLAQRRRGGCAWPLGPAGAVGDYRTLFCGAPAQAGRRYCSEHCRRAYRAGT